MFNKLQGFGFILVVLFLSACGSSSGTTPPPAPPPPPPAATMKIFATGAFFEDGRDCLLFVAAPSENLQLLSVNISHEVGTSLGTFNLGGGLTIPSDRINLQPEGFCYTKISGEYRFVFSATRPNDPTQLTINATYNQANAIKQ